VEEAGPSFEFSNEKLHGLEKDDVFPWRYQFGFDRSLIALRDVRKGCAGDDTEVSNVDKTHFI